MKKSTSEKKAPPPPSYKPKNSSSAGDHRMRNLQQIGYRAVCKLTDVQARKHLLQLGFLQKEKDMICPEHGCSLSWQKNGQGRQGRCTRFGCRTKMADTAFSLQWNTTLSHSDHLSFVYVNSLGIAPDAACHLLDSGRKAVELAWRKCRAVQAWQVATSSQNMLFDNGEVEVDATATVIDRTVPGKTIYRGV